MMCIEQDGAGNLVVSNPQPADVSSCGMVVPSGNAVVGNPFALSTDSGAAISVAILAVWAVGFGIRAVIQTLLKGSSNVEESSA